MYIVRELSRVLRWLHRHHCCFMFCVLKVYKGVCARLAGLGFYIIHGKLRFTACVPWRVKPSADFDGCLHAPAVALASSMWLLLPLEMRDSSLFRHAAHLHLGYSHNGDRRKSGLGPLSYFGKTLSALEGLHYIYILLYHCE